MRSCLRIQPDEKVTLITDHACREIAASLAHELDQLGAPLSRLDSRRARAAAAGGHAPRILDDMETSQVSIFAVKAQPNELRTRMQMTDVVNRRKMRHAHMVNIERRIMLEGMRADFDEVDRISTQVWQMAGAAREIRATTPPAPTSSGAFRRGSSGSRPAASSARTNGATCPAAKPSPRRSAWTERS